MSTNGSIQLRASGAFLALGVAVISLAIPGALLAQSSGKKTGSVITGRFEVANPDGGIRGGPSLSSGNLVFPIPALHGYGVFNLARRNQPGPFGHGTSFLPMVVNSTVDTGTEQVAFNGASSSLKDFGDSRVLSATQGGMKLLEPKAGTSFFEQKIGAGAYALSSTLSTNGVRTEFSYAPGARVPSAISLNNGESVIAMQLNASGAIEQMSLDKRTVSYRYISNSYGSFLAEVKLDGVVLVKITWADDLPISLEDGYGNRELLGYTRHWSDPTRVVLTGFSGADGGVSTISYSAKQTVVTVDGVDYKYVWATNPISKQVYSAATYRGQTQIEAITVDPLSGRVVEMQNQFGQSTRLTWGKSSSMIPEVVGLPTGEQIVNVVNSNGDLLSSTRKGNGGFMSTTSFAYDQSGRVVSVGVEGPMRLSLSKTQFTYSQDKVVPDAVQFSRTRTVEFNEAGLVKAIHSDGDVNTQSVRQGGTQLEMTANGLSATMSQSVRGDGVSRLAFASPLFKGESSEEVFAGNSSFDSYVLGRDMQGQTSEQMASASESSLFTSAHAVVGGTTWIPFLKAVRKRSGSLGNYTYETTTQGRTSTKKTKTTATCGPNGECAIDSVCDCTDVDRIDLPDEDPKSLPAPATATPAATATPTATAIPAVTSLPLCSGTTPKRTIQNCGAQTVGKKYKDARVACAENPTCITVTVWMPGATPTMCCRTK